MKCENCGKPLSRNWGLKLCSKCLEQQMTKPNPIEELKRKALDTFHNDHNDGDLAIYTFAKEVEAELQKARLEEIQEILNNRGKKAWNINEPADRLLSHLYERLSTLQALQEIRITNVT